PEVADDGKARLEEPGDLDQSGAVLRFVTVLVTSTTAPVEEGHATAAPVTHGVPVQRFVRSQVPARRAAGASPEMGDIGRRRVDRGTYAASGGIAGAEQSQVTGRPQIGDQLAHPVQRVRRCQPLSQEGFSELCVEIAR